MSHFHNTFTQKSLLTPGEMVTEAGAAAEMKTLVTDRQLASASRRSFFTKVAAGGAAASALALTGCNSGTVITPPNTVSSTPSVTDVLNFALNLEYLEAQFYAYVTTGAGIPAADMGTPTGATTGGAIVAFVNPYVKVIATQLANDERVHVELLRTQITALGGTPVSMPAINLAAGGAVNSDATFLAVARQLETVGISAYAGGAQYLVTNTATLQYAAQILDTEAQHEGFLRQLCVLLAVASPQADAMDLPPTATQIFNTNPTTGFNAVRTPSQVLQIAYAAPGKTGVTSGGFFPAGMNGNIKST